jgi:hypothetical protein
MQRKKKWKGVEEKGKRKQMVLGRLNTSAWGVRRSVGTIQGACLFSPFSAHYPRLGSRAPPIPTCHAPSYHINSSYHGPTLGHENTTRSTVIIRYTALRRGIYSRSLRAAMLHTHSACNGPAHQLQFFLFLVFAVSEQVLSVFPGILFLFIFWTFVLIQSCTNLKICSN